MGGHETRVRREFAKQAASFEDVGYPLADGQVIGWIRSHVSCGPGALVLDVAGGTGHMGRAFADTAAAAVVLDLTHEMLEAGQKVAAGVGLRNVLFIAGDAAQMPFVNGSFDLVVCRFAVHHFEHPATQIAEMARVCQAGGRVAVVDMVAAHEELAAIQNRIERLRDPSHARALTVRELRGLLEQASLSIVEEVRHDQPISVTRWLSQAQTPEEVGHAIRAQLTGELDGGAPTGMRPVMREAELCHTQRWAIILADKPLTPTGR